MFLSTKSFCCADEKSILAYKFQLPFTNQKLTHMKRYILSTCQKVIFLFAFVLTFGATAYAQPGAALKFDGVDDIVTLPPLFVGASDF